MLSYNYVIESYCNKNSISLCHNYGFYVIFMIWQRMIFNVVDMGLLIFVVNIFVVNKKVCVYTRKHDLKIPFKGVITPSWEEGPLLGRVFRGLREDVTCVMTSLAFTGLFWRKLKQIPKQKEKKRPVILQGSITTAPVSVSPIPD